MKTIVTGAAGFIGSAFSHRASVRGKVVAVDNLSRRGARTNLQWLQEQNPNLIFEELDVRSSTAMDDLLARHHDANAVVHLAGQTAVTTSVTDPRGDFEANALGTLNLLEAVRRHAPHAPFLYASTNKVYGGLEQEVVVKRGERYEYANRPAGIDEEAPLDFHSPYGCSKGAADQYVRDYARIYGMRTVVFRQSCIYGPRQFGFEEQGWVAWFAIAAATGAPITVFGDGCQVRDLLWVEDLCDLYERAIDRIDTAKGQVYNIGGGTPNSLSVRDVISAMERLYGRPLNPSYGPWRPGDQRLFIANCGKAARDLGWAPKTSTTEGISRLVDWVKGSLVDIREIASV